MLLLLKSESCFQITEKTFFLIPDRSLSRIRATPAPMNFSSTKIVMRDGSVSPAKTIKKADVGRYEPDLVLY